MNDPRILTIEEVERKCDVIKKLKLALFDLTLIYGETTI